MSDARGPASADTAALELPCLDAERHVLVSGLMGVGKTTLARALGARLGLSVLDLDEIITARLGTPIATFFREHGEAAFRAIEAEVAMEVSARTEASVIALGGGTVLDPASRRTLLQRGTMLTLTASPKTLARRLKGALDRPLLSAPFDAGATERRLSELSETRRAAYAETHATLSTEDERGDRALSDLVADASSALAEHPVVVPLGLRTYAATFGPHASPAPLAALHASGAVLVVADPNTQSIARGVASAATALGLTPHLHLLPAGEAHKNLSSLEALWDAAQAAGVQRDGAFIAVGGGVVGDVAGLAAATWLRGVRFGVVPTTVLAMADSAIGGKTAIDHGAGKNLVGAFHQPSFVRIDVQTLASLPLEDRRAGLAEIVKCAWLAGEHAVSRLEEDAEALASGDGPALLSALWMATRVKARIVSADETESGARRALNLGHTLGHAFESASGFRLRHGEAVSLGLVAASRLAKRHGIGEGPARVEALLVRLGLPVDVETHLVAPGLVGLLAADKKRTVRGVRVLLPGPPGQLSVGTLSPEAILADAREFGPSAGKAVR